MRVHGTGLDGIGTNGIVLRIIPLLHNGHPNSLRIFGPSKHTFDRIGTLTIPVTRNGHIDRFQHGSLWIIVWKERNDTAHTECFFQSHETVSVLAQKLANAALSVATWVPKRRHLERHDFIFVQGAIGKLHAWMRNGLPRAPVRHGNGKGVPIVLVGQHFGRNGRHVLVAPMKVRRGQFGIGQQIGRNRRQRPKGPQRHTHIQTHHHHRHTHHPVQARLLIIQRIPPRRHDFIRSSFPSHSRLHYFN
eukprot:scaffold32310_cov37-Attheya_sp.AAC.1